MNISERRYCGNEIILGIDGAGKTEEVKREIEQILETNEKIIIIHEKDNNGYADIKNKIVYDLTDGKKYPDIFNFNKFWEGDINSDTKVTLIDSFFVSVNESYAKSVAEVRRAIIKALISAFNEETVPNIDKILEYVKKEANEEIYTKADDILTEFKDMFDSETIVEPEGITEIIVNKKEKDFTGNLALFYMLQILFQKRTEHIWIFFDDATECISFKNNSLVSEIIRKARPYWLNVNFVFDTFSELTQAPEARHLINNSFFTIFRQTPNDAELCKDYFHLKDEETEFIKTAYVGEYLMVGKETKIMN